MAKTDGFVRLPNWLIDDADLSAHELIVYIVLLRFRNQKTGKCYPGMSTIADCARISRRSVMRAIEGLEQRQMVKVERRSTIKDNKPNIYTVALANEAPDRIWETSARGRRIPKRVTSDSESLIEAAIDQPGDSESPASDKAGPTPVTRSHPNKTYKNQIHEQAVTPAFEEVGSDRFTFSDAQHDEATEKQVAYLKDLAIHLNYATGGGIPNDLQLQRWRNLTRDEADQRIRGYLKELGRPDDMYYPQAGDPEFFALTDAGKAFAESAGQPDSVFEYGFGMKENSA
ncbi:MULTISPECIES: helix-turn-helix domain-containing protein [unclassified Microbacterium]|uniref:helix-turn-helix domain-containing protein n=1 Tax=unclassified Microbacterium TaxID=2609290 RepID=UPI001604EF37|nr:MULTISPECIES: helix-turn-helix domain-containing protein [unclassified Microbacterium]QNA92693.1 helix-turn-helix domain-containing protein [Microbacterium sp. Se63.02b]QYM62827.1 helix-turn-helix domain-containing protein [Microbacterium sp. Se5.02b]